MGGNPHTQRWYHSGAPVHDVLLGAGRLLSHLTLVGESAAMTKESVGVGGTSITRLIEHLKRWSPDVGEFFGLAEARVRFEACLTAVELAVAVADQLAAEKNSELRAAWDGVAPYLWGSIFRFGLDALDPNNMNPQHGFDLNPGIIPGLQGIAVAMETKKSVLGVGPEFQALRDDLLGLRQDPLITGLPDREREYVFHLLARVEEALAEVAVTGAADVPALVDQLIGSLTRLFLLDPDQKDQGNIRNRIKRIFSHFDAWLNSPIVTAIAGGITSGVAQITTGTP